MIDLKETEFDDPTRAGEFVNGERRRDSGTTAQVYCIVPRELGPALFDRLRRHFQDDPSIKVVVERRGVDRRRGGDRRTDPSAAAPSGERRRIRSHTGRRIAERRAVTVPVKGRAVTVPVKVPSLPRRARRFAEQLTFVERFEPTEEEQRDVEANRLVIAYQSGDSSALTELYLRYFTTIYGYSRAALRDHHEAEDVTHNAFTSAMSGLAGFQVRAEQPFRVWLLRIARNLVIDAARRKSRLHLEDPARVAKRSETAEGEERRDVDLDWLSDRDVAFLVNRLPETQRDVLVMRFVLDLRVEEIAELLGRSESSVRKQQTRALRRLESRLQAIGRTPLRSRRVPTLIRIKPAPVLAARRFALGHDSLPAGRLMSAAARAWARF